MQVPSNMDKGLTNTSKKGILKKVRCPMNSALVSLHKYYTIFGQEWDRFLLVLATKHIYGGNGQITPLL